MSDALWKPNSVSGQTTVLWSATSSGRKKREAEEEYDQSIIDPGASENPLRQGTSVGRNIPVAIWPTVLLSYLY